MRNKTLIIGAALGLSFISFCLLAQPAGPTGPIGRSNPAAFTNAVTVNHTTINDLGSGITIQETNNNNSISVLSGSIQVAAANGNVTVSSTSSSVSLSAGTTVSASNFRCTYLNTTKTGSYSISATTDYYIRLNANGLTATLPTAIGNQGKEFVIKLVSATSTGTVATTSSQTIDGSTTYSLSAQYKYVRVISNGSNWDIIGNN